MTDHERSLLVKLAKIASQGMGQAGSLLLREAKQVQDEDGVQRKGSRDDDDDFTPGGSPIHRGGGK